MEISTASTAESASQRHSEESNVFQKPISNVLKVLLDAIPDPAMIMDSDRRVIMVNAKLMAVFGLTPEKVLGQRPGEVLGCLFSGESPLGCGAGAHCSVCGSLQSVLLCQETKGQSVQECQVLLGDAEESHLDVEVTATYAVIDNMPVTLLVLRDISAEKRRSVLERLFFHDVLNTVGGIHGVAELLNGAIQGLSPEQEQEYRRWMLELSKKLIEEVLHQRRLMEAERGEFKPELGIVEVSELVAQVQALYANHEVAEGRTLQLGEVCHGMLITDQQILRRILGNLVKNALESTPAGGVVTLSCSDTDDEVIFSVNNPGVIPRDVQLQLFRRSFSTKEGSGRGMGTYSVKLFGERYLKGKITFSSVAEEGTTFTFTLPKTGIEGTVVLSQEMHSA
ncbi:PAS domain-containing protein [Geobacter pelophilus]|uniref:PAS domain-containing protein n=1 Tax=Geoanaerobacter pelophilus TaxID=60036 RepID=A0AAW4KX42_9BACT|nr:ATP-binding protein [Geoanaerobacter pelophilus]MBT0663181.1 PAS domain-containing protein [Geoanaerobacter pelophilus]